MKRVSAGVIGMMVLVAVSAVAAPPRLVNGSMSEGGATPAGWNDAFATEGQLRLARDQREHVEGPSSLRLESVRGPASGNVGLPLPNAAGQTFVITGHARAEMDETTPRNAAIVLFIRDESGKTLEWRELARITNAVEWLPFRSQVSVPEQGSNTQLVVFLNGRGKVWLDEVKIYDPENAPPPSPILSDFNAPFDFSYSDWKERIETRDGRAVLKAPSGRGGAGISGSWDLSAYSDRFPSLAVRVAPGHAAERLHLRLHDRDGTVGAWYFNLDQAKDNTWTNLLPLDERDLAHPNKINKPGEVAGLDLANIDQVELQGNWQPGSIDITLERIEVVHPDPAVRRAEADTTVAKAREDKRRQGRQAEQRAAFEAQREAFLANVPRHEESPRVTSVAPVAPKLLAVTIEAGRIVAPPAERYVARPGDVLEYGDKRALAWTAAGRVGETPLATTVVRDGEPIGWLIESTGQLLPHEQLVGEALFEPTIEEARSYRLTTVNGSGDAATTQPVAVYRKSRPINMTSPDRKPVMRHTLYLEFAEPLVAEQDYRLAFPGLNTREPSIAYRHDPQAAVSEALHVTQVGFHPDDPYKQAFLSLWLGTGAGYEFDPSTTHTFQLLDNATGETVWSGEVTPRLSAKQVETIPGKKNHNATDVYVLDFSAFNRPGVYRIYIPEVGCSHPFPLNEDGWREAFRTSMAGFLAHRSGIELGTPFSEYQRPRGFHPDDGVRVFQTDITTIDGESAAIQASLQRLLGASMEPSALEEVPNAWGGYMDAGDWDRRSDHLKATALHLELLRLFPDYFTELTLNLPPYEMRNALPDVLDEALFNLDFYRRLQQADGGVRGGVESTAHPMKGSMSWQESLLIGAFAADSLSSFRYAATAAQAAQVLAGLDPAKSDEYRRTGIKAWQWAIAHMDQDLADVPEKNRKRIDREFNAAKLLAAAELFTLTQEPTYHDAYRSWLAEIEAEGTDPRTIQSALFVYARLPESIGDPGLKNAATQQIVRLADGAIAFGDGNAFGISTDSPFLPVMGYLGYFSTPATGSPSLLYAHALTQDDKYLAAAIRACNSAVGANPANQAYTTGLGHNPPTAPLHLDSRRTRQAPPPGITVYGPSDPAADFGFNKWMHDYFLTNVVPESTTWPSSEAYLDTYLWPSMNEYTIHQTMGPTSFYFGYLAAQPRSNEPAEPE